MEKQNAIEALERLQYRIQDLSREELLAIGMAVSEMKKCAEADRALAEPKGEATT